MVFLRRLGPPEAIRAKNFGEGYPQSSSEGGYPPPRSSPAGVPPGVAIFYQKIAYFTYKIIWRTPPLLCGRWVPPQITPLAPLLFYFQLRAYLQIIAKGKIVTSSENEEDRAALCLLLKEKHLKIVQSHSRRGAWATSQ